MSIWRHQVRFTAYGWLEAEQHPVEFEESLLPARKPSHVHDINGVYAHPYERRAMGDGRNDEPSIVSGRRCGDASEPFCGLIRYQRRVCATTTQ